METFALQPKHTLVLLRVSLERAMWFVPVIDAAQTTVVTEATQRHALQEMQVSISC